MIMRRTPMARMALVSGLLGAIACTPAVVTPLPQAVRRIAVLPPYQRGANSLTSSTDSDVPRPLRMTVGDLLAQQARARLVEKGFEVIDDSIVKRVTRNRVPTNPLVAAQILQEAHLDATAMYIEVRRWEPSRSGMKTDSVIVALDVFLVDPLTGSVLWQIRRPSRPVPLYGVLLTSQAHVFVAETVMREVFAQIRSRPPNA